MLFFFPEVIERGRKRGGMREKRGEKREKRKKEETITVTNR